MRKLLNPRWLFVINTLPIAVLFFLLYGQFSIIKTLLDEESVRLWSIFGATLGGLALLNVAYAVWLTLSRRNISAIYGLVAMLCYIPYIYLYAYHVEDIIPFSVPQWMVTESLFLYVATFLMPTLLHALFVMVLHFTPDTEEHKPWISFLIAVSIPLAGYLAALVFVYGSGMWLPSAMRWFDGESVFHAMIVLIIITTLVFLFFLVRSIFIIAVKRSIIWQEYQLVWKIPVAIVFPIVGLILNDTAGSGLFGDLNTPWFYILAVLNGIFICLPAIENRFYRLVLFAGRCITFAFTFYFFMVFLPYLPLSVIFIVFIGTGFLMMTPLLLFVIHLNEMIKDLKFLKIYFPKGILSAMVVGGFLVIPLCITADYLQDKQMLGQTLEYVYTPNYSKKYDIDRISLRRTLNTINQHTNGRDIFFGSHTPYLTSYYKWLVLDNLTLSYAKTSRIEHIFFGTRPYKWPSEDIRNKDVDITGVSTNSTYDKSQRAWRSWVDLEITNHSGSSNQEYATTIDLPEGCWVSDYYLYMGDRREQGILAEKRAAMWTFASIRNENRDPGVLYYLTGNRIMFRIFPFATDELRRTGIEFLHREPVRLWIDNNRVQLGNATETDNGITETDNAVYISSLQKQSLKRVERKPYCHFLVNTSKDKAERMDEFICRIEKYLETNREYTENARISFVNTYVNTFPLDDGWQQHCREQSFEGGFYLERGIQTALFDAHKNRAHTSIVVVTDSIEKAVLDKDFSDLRFTFPESDLFLNLDSNETVHPHALVENPAAELSAEPEIFIIPTDSSKGDIENIVKHHPYRYHHTATALEYRLADGSVAYLRDNDRPEIVLKNDLFRHVSKPEIKERNFLTALSMQAHWMSQNLHPETASGEWPNMVQNSFTSKIMTSVTSYIAVENEAQKAILQKKQQQALAGNKSLDLDESTQRMSEPGIWIVVMSLGVILLCRQIWLTVRAN